MLVSLQLPTIIADRSRVVMPAVHGIEHTPTYAYIRRVRCAVQPHGVRATHLPALHDNR